MRNILYAEIAMVKLKGYAGRDVALGATYRGTSSLQQVLEEIALLANLHCRFDVLLARFQSMDGTT